MPEQKPGRLSKQRTLRHHSKGEVARRVELYNGAYKLALEQISPDQKRARPDVSLRIHASIRRQLNEGAKTPVPSLSRRSKMPLSDAVARIDSRGMIPANERLWC